MSAPKEDPEAIKARMRSALDVLENYVDDDGKINATKLTQRIAELESQLDVHERWNARCPACGKTHFTLLEDKQCQRCIDTTRIAELEAMLEAQVNAMDHALKGSDSHISELRRKLQQERERCRTQPQFRMNPEGHPPYWIEGFNAGIKAYRDAIRALEDE